MIIDKVYNEIDKELRNRRYDAKQRIEERQTEIYNVIPQVEAIDKTINTLGILLVYCAMRRTPPQKVVMGLPKEYLLLDKDGINQLIEALNSKKKQLLESSAYPCDYLDNAYSCKDCSDTGLVVVNGLKKDCECKKQMISERLKEVSGVTKSDVFSEFRIDYYPDIVDEKKYGIAVSPKILMEAIYKKCVFFAQNFTSPSTHNMVFFGNAGLGKTFLGNCIINALTDKGFSCLYVLSTSLFKLFAPGYSGQENASEMIDFVMNCEFLLIDDLGSEKYTPTRYTELIEILNTRENNSKNRLCKTIITTNLKPTELSSYYGERVTSRILGDYDILRFAGEDIRLKKKNM